MFSYILRRLLLMIPTVLGMTAVVFFVIALSPGGIGASLIQEGGEMRPQERKALEDYYNKRYGLKDSPVVQYVRWLNRVSPIGAKEPGTGFPARAGFGLKVPDLGESFARRRPVMDIIAEAVPITLLLNLMSFPIIYAIALGTGIQAARNKGKLVDIGTGTFLLALWSVPVIWAGVLAIGFLTSREYVRWFPTSGLHDVRADTFMFLPTFGSDGFERGYLLDFLWHLVLPIICMSYGSFAFLSKLSRGTILDHIAADFVRTARAKGVAERAVVYRHVLRNSLIPLITVFAGILPSVFAGSVIVENIFSINGMGKLAIDAVNQRDRELFMAVAVLGSFLTLTGYLLADICYALADPRVTYE